MFFSFLYLGLFACSAVLSSTYANTVNVYADSTLTNFLRSDSSINNALTNVKPGQQVIGITPTPSLILAGDVSETQTTSLNNFTSVTIQGKDTNGNPFVRSITGPGTLHTPFFTGFPTNSLTLTDLNISRFLNSPSGGIVSIPTGGSLNFGVSSGLTVVLNPKNTPATSGDTDIASAAPTQAAASDPTFNKNGSGELVVNTNNSGFRGTTNINNGTFTVGETAVNASALWGPVPTPSANPGGGITVQNGASLGGYGTINANQLQFKADSTGGSTWRLCIGWPSGADPTSTAPKVGCLNALDFLFTNGALIDVSDVSIPSSKNNHGYAVATYPVSLPSILVTRVMD